MPKSFDCVRMKNEAQARLMEKSKDLSDEEAMRRRREWLEISTSEVARWYRRMRDRQGAASEVREKPGS